MYICPNCKHTSETYANFCGICGAQMQQYDPAPAQQPAWEAPVQQPVQPAWQQPAQNTWQQPAQNTWQAPAKQGYVEGRPSKGKQIAGMAIASVGLFFAAIGFLYTLIGLAEPAMGFGFGLVFGLISMPLSLVGMILSKKCLETGMAGKMSQIGKTLGLVGTIVAGVMLFIAFCCLFAL